ncbi:2-amino-4-hydroxy-6-hydroxymethyldihydropteridine diphosphokinase [Spongiivirga citrea]|uniref:2-amino-4-hydroxy-6-hydroxymethyldihydropteridine pyrophosphokinase n=1 Tax=Spongiivirga citrea TaxID=1481457 RepID=A0A6M0CJN6_9FLAO|nr:2-amino-4-hydroxy-6-hydroxymethyldihydropteridine diphosphokinase [Spongiivirga citrea]NER18146.1 2-amino-4-hydroxy-6-hydroxymethyldihydropteridine diphosphokinase [Spongiivirga citrea]
MKQHQAYISIGSNLGDRHQHLNSAVAAIKKEIGTIDAVSSVYETPAWGFEGASFFNAVLRVHTVLNPDQLLDTLLRIEYKLGRVRSDEKGYQSRTIDLDILFYEDEVIKHERLQVPHPQLQNRLFILQPLADIAPSKVHPVMHKTVQQLLTSCTDEAVLTKLDIKLNSTMLQTSKLNYLVIEGNIGAGKTSLATKIANDFNGKLVLERFADNPFLPKFYKDQSRYAFPLEMSFLADRYQQFSDDLAQFDLFSDFVVADYDIYKSLIFAQVTLQDEEFSLYRTVFNIMYKEVVKPDLFIYLYQNTERLLQNIKKRGRGYEQDITPEYLVKINNGYLDYIKTQTEKKVEIIDISEMDFLSSDHDYDHLLKQINKAVHQL